MVFYSGMGQSWGVGAQWWGLAGFKIDTLLDTRQTNVRNFIEVILRCCAVKLIGLLRVTDAAPKEHRRPTHVPHPGHCFLGPRKGLLSY